MRLKKRIIDKIQQATQQSFGDVEVYLFGSRVDDSKRGGDIDIAINGDFSKDEFRVNKIRLLKYLLKSGFDFHIDIVDYNTQDDLLKSQIIANGQKLFW